MNEEFSYLIDKVNQADFCSEPFPHILIQDFFDQQHFDRLIAADQIRLDACASTSQLLQLLHKKGYEPVDFPGSVTNEKEYLKFVEDGHFKRSNIKGYGRKVIAGYGITYRLKNYGSDILNDVMGVFESEEFAGCLRKKFDLVKKTTYEGGVQKNLKGYEISPHSDTSRKALTWMVNIYTDPGSVEHKEMHTHLCKFRPEYEYVEHFWEHSDADPVWVPWSWAETAKKTNTNNSIIIFKPQHDTLHAVKVTENHLEHQRNQIYGNLWYDESQKKSSVPWQRLDLHRKRNIVERVLAQVGLI